MDASLRSSPSSTCTIPCFATALLLACVATPFADLLHMDYEASRPWLIIRLVHPGTCHHNFLCVLGYMPEFVIGSLLGALWREHLEPRVRAYRRLANAVVCVALAWFLLPLGVTEAVVKSNDEWLERYAAFYSSATHRLVYWATCAGVIVGSAAGVRCTAFLESPVLARLGEISFGVYVYHGIIISWVYRYMGGGLPQAVLATLLIVLVAEASFRLFERRLNLAIKALGARSQVAPLKATPVDDFSTAPGQRLEFSPGKTHAASTRLL